MKSLLEAGVHFGHLKKVWNPKMKKYIYSKGDRGDIHIINLDISVGLIEEAYNFVKEVVKSGKSILFVGTKKQAQDAIKEEAERCGMFYMNQRWLGGTLTNFETVKKRIDRLNRINQQELSGAFQLLPKKEVALLLQEKEKLQLNLGGIKTMTSLPGADTNCNPDLVDYVIPGNDDAIRAIKLIASIIADAVIEAKEGTTPADKKEVAAEEAAPVQE